VFKPLNEVPNPREPLLKRAVLTIPQPDIGKCITTDVIDFDFDWDFDDNSLKEGELPPPIDLDFELPPPIKLPPPIEFD